MFENIINYLKKIRKKENGKKSQENSKNAAKERLHLVLMQDRANVSADFLELMKQEIINVIKKYIDIDENEIDVRLTNKENEDGTNGAPALYANIPILNIKDDARKVNKKDIEEGQKEEKTQNGSFSKESVEQEDIDKNRKIINNKQNEPKEEIKDKSQKQENKENKDNKENKEVKEKEKEDIKKSEQKVNKKIKKNKEEKIS